MMLRKRSSPLPPPPQPPPPPPPKKKSRRPLPDWTSLPEIVWPIVFKHLDHYDLMKIIQLGQELDFDPWVWAASSKALWKHVTWTVPKYVKNEGSSAIPIPSSIRIPIFKMVEYVGPHTKTIKVTGEGRRDKEWEDQLRKISFPSLKFRSLNCVTFVFSI